MTCKICESELKKIDFSQFKTPQKIPTHYKCSNIFCGASYIVENDELIQIIIDYDDKIYSKEDMVAFGEYCWGKALAPNDGTTTFEELFENWLKGK